MSKFIEYFHSDKINKDALWSLKFGTSFGSWILIFFFLAPTLIATLKILSGIPHQGIIDFVLYYVLNPVIATLVVKWQNIKLFTKSLKFKKIYCLGVCLILSIFVLTRIVGYFVVRT